MPDDRLYIKVHNGLPDHPKVVGLSDKAFRAIVTYWCYCDRHYTDGSVPGVIALREGRKAIAELEKTGLIESRGSDWFCHDYLEHQRSAAEVKAMKEKRRSAGSLGGKARAENLASAKASASGLVKQTGSKPVAEVELEVEKEKTTLPRKRGSRLPNDWKPSTEDIAWQRTKAIADDLARREFEKFGNYWRSKSGATAVKLDWSGVWRNWLLTAQERVVPVADAQARARIAARASDPLASAR